jgi:hypothetical protein
MTIITEYQIAGRTFTSYYGTYDEVLARVERLVKRFKAPIAWSNTEVTQ